MSFGFSQSRASNNSDSDSDQFGSNGIPSGLETGAILRERREAMGVTLEEAEASIRIRQKYLSAMEADEWHLLPGEIVGRGFLRNYAAYLDLEPDEMLERRRSVIEPRLAAALRSTSAGSALPAARAVNYDPKELDLKDEPEGIDGASFNFRGLIPLLVIGILAYVVWQGFDLIQGAANTVSTGVQTRFEEFRASATPLPSDGAILAATDPTATPVADSGIEGTVSTNTVGAIIQNEPNSDDNGGSPDSNADNPQSEPTPTPEPPTPVPEPPTPTPEPPTPVPEPPTPTPEPPTPVPEPPTPIPEPPTPVPVVVAPACPDVRSIITAPGANQVVSGAIEVFGSATHEAFQFYKLEYAPGANASDGWAYFDGGNNPVSQGRLGTLDTPSLANGSYSVRLVVVDLSANFPPPCQVSFTIQN